MGTRLFELDLQEIRDALPGITAAQLTQVIRMICRRMVTLGGRIVVDTTTRLPVGFEFDEEVLATAAVSNTSAALARLEKMFSLPSYRPPKGK